MSAEERVERVASDLLAATVALRGGHPGRAIPLLEGVLADDAFARAEDLADVRARAHTLLAQALLATPPVDGDRLEALLDRALAIDPGAVRAVEELRQQWFDHRQALLEEVARKARAERLAEADVEALLARVVDPERRMELLVQKAQAEVQAGRPRLGAALAERAMAQGASLQVRVMARLVLATARPEMARAELHAAHAEADAASEFNLVAAVARTAEILQIPLPVQVGPTRSSR